LSLVVSTNGIMPPRASKLARTRYRAEVLAEPTLLTDVIKS